MDILDLDEAQGLTAEIARAHIWSAPLGLLRRLPSSSLRLTMAYRRLSRGKSDAFTPRTNDFNY